MRIISKFRDYYDGVNPSKDPFWKRMTREVELDVTKKSELSIHQQEFCAKSFLQIAYPKVENPLVDDYCTIKVLGLCGKLYPVYEMRYKDHFKSYLDIEKFITDYNKLSPKTKKQKKSYCNTFTHNCGRRYLYYNHSLLNVLSCYQWNTDYQKKEYVDQLFIDMNTPVFILHTENYRSSRVILDANPCLKDYGIQRLFDVYSLYQMIEQYLTNELVMNTDIPSVMSDKIKRDKHGFHNMSFKNRGKNSNGML